MWQRLRNWLSDDAVQEKDDTSWGLPLWWGAGIVALFTVVIAWCHVPAEPNLLEVADGRPQLSIFRSLIATAGVEEQVAAAITADFPGLTFLAPSDAAFAALPEELLAAATSDPNIAFQLLAFHVIEGKVSLADLVSLQSVTTGMGVDMSITERDGTVFFDTAAIIGPDLQASNGNVHMIDTVLGLRAAGG